VAGERREEHTVFESVYREKAIRTIQAASYITNPALKLKFTSYISHPY
jgi:hypothetical protein